MKPVMFWCVGSSGLMLASLCWECQPLAIMGGLFTLSAWLLWRLFK